jgi:hypothetical protein
VVSASVDSPDRRWAFFSSDAERLAWIVAFAAVILLRLPGILIHGRFWAEEGNPIYQDAWSMPWYDVLTLSYGGYLSVIPNLAGLLARHLVPLDYAPYVTITIALLIQICPAILLVTATDEWLSDRVRLLAALLLVATPPATEEVWLATIHAQVHLGLCAALILALDVRGGAVGIFRYLLLLVGALTGPGAWTLIPLFLLRAALDRSWHRATQGAVIALGVAIQLLFFFNFHLRPDRVFAGPRMQLLIFFVRHLLLPLFGVHLAGPIATDVRDQVVAAHAPIWPMVVTVLVFGSFVFAVLRWRARPSIWLLLAGGTLAVAGYSGAFAGGPDLLYPNAGQRYSFAPTVLFEFALLPLACLTGRIRWAASALIIWLIVVGVLSYAKPSAHGFAAGPDWRSEVAAWRADPTRRLAIWPDPWSLRLPPDAH